MITTAENALRLLDALLASDLSPLLSRISGVGAKVCASLDEQRAAFDRACERLGKDPRAALLASADATEKQLASLAGDLTASEGMGALIASLYEHAGAVRRNGLYLTDAAASRLLEAHPPENLGADILPGDARGRLALTRHSEPSSWQESYRELLASLAESDFERRAAEYRIIEERDFKAVRRYNWKPWQISHNKEAGIINCFTHPVASGFRTPVFLRTALFLHYLAETERAGAFFSSLRPSELGPRMRNTITNTSGMFSFFQPHLYSETFFWIDALETFTRITGAGGEIMSEYDLGGMRNGEWLSLNIIDVLWDANFAGSGDAKAYFGAKNSRFLYHFREGYWTRLFPRLVGMAEDRFRHHVLTHLDVGDAQATEELVAATMKV